MSAVVLRCPNCGTTQGVPGECEACHEAPVRYYCTNHSPGRWLEAQVCSQCGAVYGRAEPAPAPPRPSKPAPVSPPASRRGTSEVPTPPRKRSSWSPPGPWGRRSPPIAAEEDYVSREVVARARALERLRELLGGAYARRRAPFDMETASYSAGPIAAGGCLRLLVLIFLLLTLSYCSLSLLGSGMMFYF